LRFGDLYVAAHGSELFSSFSLDLRRRWPHADLMAEVYANDSLSYMPDAHDVERCTYAAAESPKFTGHFPFTAESGGRLVDGMLAALEKSRRRQVTPRGYSPPPASGVGCPDQAGPAVL